jgi:hypothetical protein
MALGSTQPQREMSTKNLPGDKGRAGGRAARKADNLTPSVSRLSRNYGSLESHNHMGLHGLLQGELLSFLPFIHSRQESLDRGLERRKAATYTNTE